jgi:outer membrane protein assembly factor BamD
MQVLQRIAVFWILAMCLGLAGCSYFSGKKDETEGWPEEKMYYEAKDALDGGNYTRAVELYEKLQGRYPFGQFAQQAQIDLAFAYYKKDEPASAAAACDRFIKLYPGNPGVDYAYYLKGLANFSQGKGITERYLPLDTSQRDQGAAAQSFQDFTELVKRFPDSKYAEDAKQRMIYLRNILAQHEVHVAHYYMRRGAYVAAANRARYVVENYQQTPAIPEALVVMAKAYKVLDMQDLSDDALRVLELNFPNHPGIDDVRTTVVK